MLVIQATCTINTSSNGYIPLSSDLVCAVLKYMFKKRFLCKYVLKKYFYILLYGEIFNPVNLYL